MDDGLENKLKKNFPNLISDDIPGIKVNDKEALPKLLKNERDRTEFAHRQSYDKNSYLKSTAATKFGQPDDQAMKTNQFSNTMRSTDFPRVKTGATDADTIFNIKQGNTYENKPIMAHHRTRSLTKGKVGKTANGQRRKDLNPNNLFLRQQPSSTAYSKDPTTKYMKMPFLDNLPMYQKHFYANKKGFVNLFEDITKINLIFSEVIETVL